MNIFLDKLFLTSDAWWIRLIWNRWTRSFVISLIQHLPIRRGRCIFISRAGSHYSCNPRFIAEYIAKESIPASDSMFDIWFSLLNPEKFNKIPNNLGIVIPKTLAYYYIYSTSQFIISNQLAWDMEPKRSNQLYIQTLHGGHGIKRFGLDGDAKDSDAKSCPIIQNSKITDLVLSDSVFFSQIIKRACALSCEILEKGLPRNDIFFASKDIIKKIRENFLKKYKLPENGKFLIYGPTYRDNGDLSVYGFNEDRVLDSFSRRFGGKWYLLISSHPYMKRCYKKIYDFTNPRIIDVGELPDVQELLISGDALITDYSSIEMDFSLTKRPVFQYAKDWREYDRGTYLDIHTLPFPFAETEDELCHNIETFDNEKYQENLELFNRDVIGLKETGHATEAVVNWMKQKIYS